MISGHLRPEGQRGALQFPERVSGYFPAGGGQPGTDAFVSAGPPKLGPHPWPGPRDPGWFPAAEEAVLFVSADGPVASHLRRGASGEASWSEPTSPAFEKGQLAGLDMAWTSADFCSVLLWRSFTVSALCLAPPLSHRDRMALGHVCTLPLASRTTAAPAPSMAP